MYSRAGCTRAKYTKASTGSDALEDCPCDSRGVVFVDAYICKATVTSCGLAVCSPEEGDNLCTRDSCVGAECLRAGAFGDAVFNSPQYSIVEVILGSYVIER